MPDRGPRARPSLRSVGGDQAGEQISASPGDAGSDAGRSAEELVALSARGDQVAFAELYDLVAAPVFGVVRRVLRDPAQSEEVTQEVLIEVWLHCSRFDPRQGAASTWILTIAHRRAVDRVRAAEASTRREQQVFVRDQLREFDEVVDEVERRLDAEQVRRCLDNLTDLQRESLVLAYYGGHTYAQVGELLKTPLGTVKTRLRDGLIRLRDCLGVTQ